MGDAFIKMLKANKFEAALLQALPPVLAKEPATRTEFDSLVLSNLEEAITTEISKLDKVVQDLVPSKEERTGAATAAESAVEAAKAQVEAADVAQKDAESAIKGGEVVVKDAKKALKAFGPGAKEAETVA